MFTYLVMLTVSVAQSSAVNRPKTRRTYLMIVSIFFYLVSRVGNHVTPFVCQKTNVTPFVLFYFICNPMSHQVP